LRKTWELLSGSSVVYVVVAACGAAGGSAGSAGNGDGGRGGSSSGAESDGPGILDAITDPVADALADPYQSGTRIRMQYYAGADGSKTFAGTYDSMLKVTCSFATAADGKARCVPFGTGVIDAALVYADAACAQPLGSATKGCSPGAFASAAVASGPACGSSGTFHVYPVGSAFTPGTDVYEKSGTTCVGVPSSNITQTFDLYQLGSELPSSTFVQGTLQAE